MNEDNLFAIPDDEINAIEVIDLNSVLDVDSAVDTYRQMVAFVTRVLTPGVDYGIIPGTNKPSLWKPGAEKMRRFFSLYSTTRIVEKTEQWSVPITETQYPLFSYDYETILRDSTGKIIATCESNCNSFEDKYRWRWSNTVPDHYDVGLLHIEPGTESEFEFAIKKRETTGQYGKPEEYWDQWNEDIESGVAKKTQRKAKSGKEFDAYEREGTRYRLPNERIYDQVNTLKKMAQKRSFVGAILLATGGSEFFTQDLEDYAKHLDVETSSLHMFVPSRNAASHELIGYVKSRGVTNAGTFIKDTLEKHEKEFLLEDWIDIINLLDEELDKKETENG